MNTNTLFNHIELPFTLYNPRDVAMIAIRVCSIDGTPAMWESEHLVSIDDFS